MLLLFFKALAFAETGVITGNSQCKILGDPQKGTSFQLFTPMFLYAPKVFKLVTVMSLKLPKTKSQVCCKLNDCKVEQI